MVILGARSRDPRFMASFVLTGGCAIARKIFGGHEGDKGFHEMYVVSGRNGNSALSKLRERNVYSDKISFACLFIKIF